MELLEYLRTSVKLVNEMVDMTMEDLTDEVVNFEPGGTSNTIAQLLAHMVSSQDAIINQRIGGGRSLHETGWAEKSGIPLDRSQIWQREAWKLDLAGFDAYRKEVAQQFAAALEAINAEDLDREIELARGPSRSLAMTLQAIVINHSLGHCGEVSAIKGMQGLKGLPI